MCYYRSQRVREEYITEANYEFREANKGEIILGEHNTQTLIRKRLKEIFYINELYTTVFKNINRKRKKKQFFRSLITTMSFLGHLQVLVFLYALLLFSAESRKTQLFDTESSADDGAEHENYGDKIQNAPVGSPQRQEAQKNLLEEINHRKKIDQNIIEILRLSLKKTDVLDLLTSTRTTGQPVVDDWDCYKTLVKSFKNQCGAKMEYDMKYAGGLANICNMGVDVKKSVAAIEEALSDRIRLGGTRVNISYSRVMLYGLQFYNLEPEQLIKSSYILVNGTNRQSQNIGYDFCCRPKNPKDKP
ncbi:hypothetical protein YC2023_012025 [Brassica napus]